MIFVAALTLTAGCVVTGRSSETSGGRSTSPGPSASSSAPSAAVGPDVVQLRGGPGNLPDALVATTQSLVSFWNRELPAVYGQPFRELEGGVQAKTASSEPWTCGGQQFTYRDVRGNAFYCGGPQDDYIAYDAASLLPRLNRAFGALTPAVVLAHEMGHAVQARVGVDSPSVVQELQADCFAGAWVAFAEHSPTDPVEVAPAALDASVRALPSLRDQPGTPATNPQAHGLAFDRVNAYQTGYESGVSRCSTFPQGEVTVTELPFSTVAEAQTGGNLPYSRTVEVAVERLETFWSAALQQLDAGTTWRSPRPTTLTAAPLPACPGDRGYDESAVAAFCATENTVVWADVLLGGVHGSLGDVAAASALSLSWARAAQAQTGAPTTGTRAELQQVCLTGAWLSAIASDASSPVTLSPGDIDEALFVVLTPLALDRSAEVEGSSFERADALRTGLLGGVEGC